MSIDLTGLEHFAFGDSPELADALLALVLAGTKTATCWAARDLGPSAVGQRSVVLDGRGAARAVIETVQIRACRFADVDAAFAYDEGEDDRSLPAWRAAHRAYFERNGGFAEDMPLWCERFRLVQPLPQS